MAQPQWAPQQWAPVRPRWGYQASLWQWRNPAFWLFAIWIVGGSLYSVYEQSTWFSLGPAAYLIGFVILVLYSIPMVLLIYYLDLYEREPVSLVLAALAFGIVGAGGLAGIANGGWTPVVADLVGPAGNQVGWVSAIMAPVTEEILKGVGVVLIYLIARDEIDDLLDGFVYGALVGFGFAVIEHLVYFIYAGGGSVGGMFEILFIRVVAGGVYGHVLWTALVGLGVAYFVTRRREATAGKRFAVAGGLFIGAMLMHFLWNSPLLTFYPDDLASVGDYVQWFLAAMVKGLPFFLFLVVLVVLARRREHRWLRAALQEEVGLQGLHHDELVTLERPKLRRQARRNMRGRYGPVAGRTLKELQRAHVELAMIATRTEDPSHPDLVAQRQYCEALRNWLVQATGHRGSTLAWDFTAQPASQQPPAGS